MKLILTLLLALAITSCIPMYSVVDIDGKLYKVSQIDSTLVLRSIETDTGTVLQWDWKAELVSGEPCVDFLCYKLYRDDEVYRVIHDQMKTYCAVTDSGCYTVTAVRGTDWAVESGRSNVVDI